MNRAKLKKLSDAQLQKIVDMGAAAANTLDHRRYKKEDAEKRKNCAEAKATGHHSLVHRHGSEYYCYSCGVSESDLPEDLSP